MNDVVKVVLVNSSEEIPDHVIVKACEYVLSADGSEHIGRMLSKDECGDNFDEFITNVMDDMDVFGYSVMLNHAKFAKDGDWSDTQLFMSILTWLQHVPVEVLGNLFATMLLRCCRTATDEPDFEKSFEEWKEFIEGTHEAKA